MTLEEKIEKLINPKNSTEVADCGRLTVWKVPVLTPEKTWRLTYQLIFNPTNFENINHPRFVETWADTIEEGVDQLLKDCKKIDWK